MANPIASIILTAVDKTKAAFASVKNGLFGIEQEATRTKSTFDNFGSQIGSVFSRLGLSLAALYNIRALGGMLDDFSNLQARLKLASRDTEEYNAANRDLVRIAEEAKTPIAETATLYTRIAAAVKDLDVSQKDVAATTEAIALALKISGATAEEQASAMLQFSQSIASGTLRGEEFNAVNEAAPRIMQALANSLKVPVGNLRQMAQEGKLTRDVLVNGLLNELPKLQQEAATLPDTIGSSFTKLKNKLFLAAGEFDKATGFTKGFSESIRDIGKTGLEAFAVLAANVAFVFKGVGREIGGIAAQLNALAHGDFKGFKFIGDSMKADAAKARAELDAFEQRILNGTLATDQARQKSSNETRDVIIRNKQAEAAASKTAINEQLSDAQRLQSALQSAFEGSLRAEEDYLRQAKKLRAEANGTTPIAGDVQSQASASLDAITKAMKLQREAGTASLQSVQDQSAALQQLAGQLDDQALKSDLIKQAKLAEASALEKAAADEKQRYTDLGKIQDDNLLGIQHLKGALDGIGKEVSVEIKLGKGTEDTLASLREMRDVINQINATPIALKQGAGGADIASALRTEAAKFGRRQ